MDTGQWVAVGLSLAIGAWFIAGYWLNRQRAEAIFLWLREGLAQFGEISETERAGRPSNAFRLAVGRPVSPFQRVEAVYLLESRENMPLWIYGRLRGQRDELVLRVTLRTDPNYELETASSDNQEFRKLVAGEQKKPYQLIPASHGFEIAHRGKVDPETIGRLRGFVENYGVLMTQLSFRRKAPHLYLRVRLPGLLSCSSVRWFGELKMLLSSPKNWVGEEPPGLAQRL